MARGTKKNAPKVELDTPVAEAMGGAPAVAAPVVEAPAPIPQMKSEGGIKAEVFSMNLPPKEKVIRYWIGTIPGSPYQNVHIAGICFPAFTEEDVADPVSGKLKKVPRRGCLIEITEKKLATLREQLRVKILRRMGPRAIIRNTEDPRYRRDENDVPLAAFVYMVRVEDQMPAQWRDDFPTPMVALPKPQ